MSNTTTNPNEKIYKINLVKGSKKWNIAKFSNKIDLSTFSKPVRMYKFNPVANMINNESNNFGLPPNGGTYYNNYYNRYNNNYNNNNNNSNANAANASTTNATNPTTTTTTTTTTTSTTTTAAGTPANPAATAQPLKKKKYEPKPVNPKTIPWKLEDSEGNNTYQGNVEGNQASSNYFLFMFQSDGSIKAVPCNDWYNFRPKKDFQSLTTEEAEDFMKKKNQEWDVFTSRLSKKSEAASGGSADSGKKGGVDVDEDLEIGRNKNSNIDPDKYGTKSEEKKKKKTPARRREREEENAEDGDAPDFESRFDDDDDDTYMDGDGLTGEDGPQIEEDEEEAEADLTEGGLEMKKMIKKQQKSEDDDSDDDDDDKSKDNALSGEDDDDDDDEDPDQDDLSNLPKNLYGKNADGSTPAVKKEGEDGKDSSSSKSSKKSKKQKDGSPKSKEKKSKKNKSSSDGIDSRESKKVKKEPSSPPPQQQPAQPTQQPTSPTQANGSADEPPFTEDYIKIVLQRSKKVRSIDLINIFKGPLKNPANKQIFLSMVYNVARVVEEGGVKYLIPK